MWSERCGQADFDGNNASPVRRADQTTTCGIHGFV